MSNLLRIYRRNEKMSDDEREMSVTAFVGGETGSVQFTIGGEYCCLSDAQLKDLIKVLNKRMLRYREYRATDTLGEEIINEYGEVELE